MPEALLDTDTLSLLRRSHSRGVAHTRTYLRQFGVLTLSELSRYEAVRGYKKINATRQLATFEQFCQQHRVLPLDWPALEQAAEVWSDLSRRGELIGEVDVWLAGTALARGLAVVSHNTAHSGRINGLLVLDWTV